jgi:hypothetical protein
MAVHPLLGREVVVLVHDDRGGLAAHSARWRGGAVDARHVEILTAGSIGGANDETHIHGQGNSRRKRQGA